MATENNGLPEPTVVAKMPRVVKPKGGTIKVEVMSLDQFRSYLKGIMFVGGPTWRPDRDQWEAIVAIIDKLTIDVPRQPAQQYAASQHGQPAQAIGWDQTNPQWTPMPPQQAPRSSLDGNGVEDGPYQTPFV